MISAGSLLAGYRADRRVGRGATATVFAATRLADGRRVALKLLDPQLSANPVHVRQFRSAARLQQELRHPSILEVYEVGDADGQPFLAMRFVDGETLAALVDAGSLAVDRALEVLSQVAGALDFAHAAGVTHGDVKPRNILVEGSDAFLTDFGLAAGLGRGPGIPASLGTIDYSAPERLRGERPTPSTDVYGLACVLFECLTGRVPYPQEHHAAVIGAHLFTRAPQPSEVVPGMPAALDDVVAGGLDKDAARRPATCGQLIADARAAVGRVAHLVPPPRRREAAPRRLDDTLVDPVPALPAAPAIEVERARTLSWPLAAGGALALASIVAVGAWLGHRPAGPPLRAAGNDSVGVTVPAAWDAVRPPSLAGLPLRRAIAFAPRRRPRRSTLVIGFVRGMPPTFAPPTVAARTGTTERALVRLSRGVAYRYERIAATVPVLYVVPGPDRSVVVACVASRPARADLRQCEGVARTLEIRRGATYDPRPSLSFGAAVNAALHVLLPARRNGLRELAKAETRRAQAHWAYATAIGYRTTAASLRRTRPPAIAAGPTRALTRAVGRAGVAYTRLSAATRNGDRLGYEAASGDILAAESRLRGALQDLGALGYDG